jgi:hypothetical protein
VLLLVAIWLACALPALILLIDRPIRFSVKTLLLVTTFSAITHWLLIIAVKETSPMR